MQKGLFTMVLFCFLSFFLATPVFAATFIDDMDRAESNSVKSYQNLQPAVIGVGNRDKLPDKTFVTFANPSSPIGAVTYLVNGAEQIMLRIYTSTGTFVSEVAGMPGIYALGIYNEATAAQVPVMATRALYSVSRRLAYTIISGQAYKLCFSNINNLYKFEHNDAGQPDDLISYGVNLWVSSDGQNYRRIELTASGMSYIKECSFCYEEFIGNIPAGTTYVRVEINDMTSIPYDDGTGNINKNKYFMTGLAMVKIDGINLVEGENAPVQQEPTYPVSSSSSSSKSSSSVKSSSATKSSSSTKSGSVSSTPSQKTTSSSGTITKFEGVITDSSANTSASSGRVVASSKSGGDKPPSSVSSQHEVSQVTPAKDFSQSQPVIHKVETKGESMDSMFSSAVAIYIAIVAGFIIFAAILKLKK